MMFIRNLFQCYSLRRSCRLLHCSHSVSNKNGNFHPPPEFSDNTVEELLENASVERSQRLGDERWLKSPYTQEDRRNQALKAMRPKVDPRETTIILFPGQGVQHVGMGKNLVKLPQVRDMYKEASTILGYDLLKLSLEGPKEKLDQTVYCQPAIYVASLAALQLMIEERRLSVESCIATAGFSVGEFAALVLAKSLSFQTGLRLVKLRAELMQSLAENVRGGMLTLFLEPAASIGTILGNAREWCLKTGVEGPVCSVANYLYPNCRVVAGNEEALKFIEENSKNLRIRRCKRIPVSGAFHSDLMKPAAEEFTMALKKANVNDPDISVHSNIDGLAYRDAKDIKRKLPKQIYRPVKWEQVMHVLYERKKGTAFPLTFEVGPGQSLSSLLKHQNASAGKEIVNIFA